jgi:dihydroorotate dehydrogenase subfamily 1
MTAVDFSTTFSNAWFPTPVFTASGCASSGKELAQFFPLKDIGAVVTKSIMNKARLGRATPRMAETPSGMLNSIGLQGPGIDTFIEKDIPWLVEQKARIIVSIAGETIEEYSTLARKLRSVSGISAIEVNISCPNVENRGLVFACDPEASRKVIDGVRRTIGGELPIIAKLSPDVTDIVDTVFPDNTAVADVSCRAAPCICTVGGVVYPPPPAVTLIEPIPAIRDDDITAPVPVGLVIVKVGFEVYPLPFCNTGTSTACVPPAANPPPVTVIVGKAAV